MKHKTFGLALGLIIALIVVGTAFATAEPPPEPTCPEGQITVAAAVWVSEVPAVSGHCHVVLPGWGNVSQYYQHNGNSANCSLMWEWRWLRWLGLPQTVQGAWVPGTPAVPGYWIPPVCREPVAGCTDPLALNFNAQAEVDDGSCQYPPVPVPGCTDPVALNFDPLATVDDGSCQYPPELIPGCMDEAALNYNPEATVDDGTCEYPCPLTPLYHIFVLRDFDAPAGYLQGGTCYVISNTIPSVERQAAICTYPFCGTGWTYRADSIPYGGYVYRDCHGDIVYGWSAWDDSWLRTDFTMDGRDSDSPRLPCCE